MLPTAPLLHISITPPTPPTPFTHHTSSPFMLCWEKPSTLLAAPFLHIPITHPTPPSHTSSPFMLCWEKPSTLPAALPRSAPLCTACRVCRYDLRSLSRPGI
jgi:hypothetical protein